MAGDGGRGEGSRLLSVRGLSVSVGGHRLVERVDLDLAPGARVGLIGESGSGKSLTALSITGLLDDGLTADGEAWLDGVAENLLRMPEKRLAGLRGDRIGMVFQEPLSALDPMMRIGDQVAEPFTAHGTRPNRRAARAAAVELLDRVRLPDPEQAARAYPHQLSGGQRQRVGIAMAIANDPALLICDEPTSALDVTVQAQILELIRTITADQDTGLLFITHDLAVVAQLCERVVVLRNGRVVESGTVESVFARPAHPYTRELLAAANPPSTPPSAPPQADGTPLIAAGDLGRTFRRPRASLRGPRPRVDALVGVDLRVEPRQRFGIVGESGSGKSTLVRLLAGLDHPTTGSIRFDGTEIGGLPERRLGFLRAELQMVFQDPTGSLDPRMRVRDIIAEPLLAANRRAGDAPIGRVDRAGRGDRVAELLEAVGLPAEAADRYPHQFSGGQRQRISIARALAPRPKVLVADEPVSALDAPIRGRILRLLTELADTYRLTLVLVSHDLTVIRHVCDTVAVLQEGRIVEHGPTMRVFTDPQHPYTARLLAAVPPAPSPR